MDDVRNLLPHHKVEPKFDKTLTLSDINEVCELKNCNNCIYFEVRTTLVSSVVHVLEYIPLPGIVLYFHSF
jgi:hypothetical protein